LCALVGLIRNLYVQIFKQSHLTWTERTALTIIHVIVNVIFIFRLKILIMLSKMTVQNILVQVRDIPCFRNRDNLDLNRFIVFLYVVFIFLGLTDIYYAWWYYLQNTVISDCNKFTHAASLSWYLHCCSSHHVNFYVLFHIF
jgi:hypothetical protein